jgi:hypothetical protein
MRREFALTLLAGMALAQEDPAQTGNPEIYEGLIFGVGPGTFAVILVTLLSMIMCIFKDASASPSGCVALAFVPPLVTLAIVMSMPVQSLESDAEKEDQLPTSTYLVRTGLCCGLIFVAACSLCVLVSYCNFKIHLFGTRIDSAGLMQNDDKFKMDRQETEADTEMQQVQDPAPQGNQTSQHNDQPARPSVPDENSQLLVPQNLATPVRAEQQSLGSDNDFFDP